MSNSRGITVLAGILVLLCAVIAWEWYAHVRESRTALQPVQQVTPAPPAATPAASPSYGPVVYVPQQAQPSPKPAAPETPAPQQSAAPATTSAPASPAPTPAPYATSGAALGEEPMVTATLAPHIMSVRPVRESTDAPPRILAMSISTPVAHNGEVVSGTVETSSNVASVEARIAGYSSSMKKIGVGRFAMSYRVPNLPFFLHRTYTIEVIARNTRGDAVRTAVPITIR